MKQVAVIRTEGYDTLEVKTEDDSVILFTEAEVNGPGNGKTRTGLIFIPKRYLKRLKKALESL